MQRHGGRGPARGAVRRDGLEFSVCEWGPGVGVSVDKFMWLQSDLVRAEKQVHPSAGCSLGWAGA